jgi:hypothetical protein
MKFEKGTTMGVVGESGCGKSTLCRVNDYAEMPLIFPVIQRFYENLSRHNTANGCYICYSVIIIEKGAIAYETRRDYRRSERIVT